ncbi:Zinc transporter [Coemansia sp. Benny D115]|nr:Zinc transporter [Coemansia sp. Benny D115]
MSDDSTLQAWLFAMTSGIASALGAVTLYLDPLLHLLGVPSSWNLLDSHTVLSALLAGASGIMAYTSISVLTRESTEYFSQITSWPLVKEYPGALTALLFVLGAHINLLLVRVVAFLTPADSPIQHTCASHPPSPSTESQLEDGGGHPAVLASHPARKHNHETQPLLLSGSSETTQPHRHEMQYSTGCCCHHTVCCQNRAESASLRCEYACNEPNCYRPEHCHITPLYPHIHTHESSIAGDGHMHSEEEAVEGDMHRGHLCSRRASSGCLSHAHASTPSVVSCGAGHSAETAHGTPSLSEHSHSHNHAHSHHDHHHSHSHSHDHDHETHVQLAGPDASGTASQISSRHQRLLIHVGLQTAVAIALHKIPEGLIIYLSRQASPKLGISVAASLFFHNLPEGLMLALPLYLATRRRHLAFVVSSLMGALPPAIGAALGMLVVNEGGHGREEKRMSGIFGVAFGITAGMMCMVSLNGMLPTARIYDKSGNVVAWCFALGVAAMLFANTTLK